MESAVKTVAELYRVFAKYEIGDEFAGCDHCVDPARSQHLVSTSLTELTAQDLDSYAFKAMTTWGNVDHFDISFQGYLNSRYRTRIAYRSLKYFLESSLTAGGQIGRRVSGVPSILTFTPFGARDCKSTSLAKKMTRSTQRCAHSAMQVTT